MRILMVLLLASAIASAAEPTTRPAPVAAIWFESGYPVPGKRDDETRKLIVGVWGDGTSVWSVAETGMGKPYKTARLDPAAVEKLVKDLDAIGFFGDEEVNHHRNRYPPDAGHTVMAAESGEKKQRLALWRDPPKDRFGEVWTKARKLIEELRPAEGKPVEELDQRVFQLGRNVR
jgi:hypothetical protein